MAQRLKDMKEKRENLSPTGMRNMYIMTILKYTSLTKYNKCILMSFFFVVAFVFFKHRKWLSPLHLLGWNLPLEAHLLTGIYDVRILLGLVIHQKVEELLNWLHHSKY